MLKKNIPAVSFEANLIDSLIKRTYDFDLISSKVTACKNTFYRYCNNVERYSNDIEKLEKVTKMLQRYAILCKKNREKIRTGFWD